MGKTRRPKEAGEGSSKKTVYDMEWCEVCECEIRNTPSALAEHFNSESKHKRKEKLFLLGSFFAKHGLNYFPARTTYFCEVCSMSLPNNVEDLHHHLEKYAHRHINQVKVEPIPLPKNGKEVFVKKTIKLVDFESTNDALNAQLSKLCKVTSPITVVECGPCPLQVFYLRDDVFTSTELNVITKVASYLEKHGRSVSRSVAKGSTRMYLWGMRSAYGNTGWFVQDDYNSYGLSEDFARYVCQILRRSYGSIFEHLDDILKAEGFHGNDAMIGGGPFSSFSVSRDFNCRPHTDDDDYGYGFIFWLREDAVPNGVEPILFAFPESGVSFVPKHGDVLCFRPGQYMYCTRRLQRTNILGIVFFQKCSLYRQLAQLIRPEGSGVIQYESADGEINIVETREGFLKKKVKYEQQVRDSTLTISQFMT